MVHVKFGANCVTNGQIMAKKRFDLTTLTCHILEENNISVVT